MAILKILQYPDIRLTRISQTVEHFDATIQQFIDDMFETHYATLNCAALAATQLDVTVPWRVTVIDYSPEKNQPLCLVNAHITSSEGEQNENEGCMSVYPDSVHAKVKRAMHITVSAQDRNGAPFELKASGYLAKCIQHELDHLDGKIYLDKLNFMQLERANRKLKKILRSLKK